MLLVELEKRKLIQPPSWLSQNTQFLCMTGSIAYGVATDTSDRDIYGWTIPKREEIFSHLNGHIEGFGRQKQRFEQYIQHHIFDSQAMGGKGCNYDFTVFGIVKYFHLCMENNPNMIDSLFVPQNCVIHITKIGQMLRERRREFLHKGIFFKLKGYSFSQLHKARTKNPLPEGNRAKIREEFDGKDVKFLYHVVRLLSQCEQVLIEGDLDLQEEGRREHMKAIRRGEVSEEEIINWFNDKEKQLEQLYHTSKLPYKPNEEKIKQLLIDCLEEHYGSLENCVRLQEPAILAIEKITEIINKYNANKTL